MARERHRSAAGLSSEILENYRRAMGRCVGRNGAYACLVRRMVYKGNGGINVRMQLCGRCIR